MASLPCLIVSGLCIRNGLAHPLRQTRRRVPTSPFPTHSGMNRFANRLALGLLESREESSNALHLARSGKAEGSGRASEEVDISVFRFTLGIPGFSDAELPRILGIVFGGLLILNHAFSLDTMTGAQLRSEVVGLILAAVSISLPVIGRQLNETKASQVRGLELGRKQIFSLADGLSETQRQDLAWASYNLLRNTSTVAVLVWHDGGVVGARGFWDLPTDPDSGTTEKPLELLKEKSVRKLSDFSKLEEPLYVTGNADAKGWDVVPSGAASLLVQPFPRNSNAGRKATTEGFLLLVSNTTRGFRRKDRDWAAVLAKKLARVLQL